MPTAANNAPLQATAAPPEPGRRSLIAAFAPYMVPPRKPGAPPTFKPDYNNRPRVNALAPDAERFFLEFKRKPIAPELVRARAYTAIHEASHAAGYVLTRNSVRWVRISDGKGRRIGEVNTSCHDSPVVEAFHALMGVACELELGLGLHGAADDMESARQAVGPGADGVSHGDVPEVLEIARGYFREARSAINFIATWLLACSSSNGLVEGPRLREIMAAASPALLAAAERLRLIPRLNGIQQRRGEAYRAVRPAGERCSSGLADGNGLDGV